MAAEITKVCLTLVIIIKNIIINIVQTFHVILRQYKQMVSYKFSFIKNKIDDNNNTHLDNIIFLPITLYFFIWIKEFILL